MRALVILLVAAMMVALGAVSYASGDLLSLTNADRASNGPGLAPLTSAPDLQAYAQGRAQEMMKAGKLWHSPTLGTAVTNWRTLGENVGRGPSLPAIEAAFMASPAHRANILRPEYSQAGIGVVSDGAALLYVAVIFRQPITVAAPKAMPAPARGVASIPPPTARPKPTPAPAPALSPPTPVPPPPPPEPARVEEPAPVARPVGPSLSWVLEATTGESVGPPPASPALQAPDGASPALVAAAMTGPSTKDGSSALLLTVAFLGVVCAWRGVLVEARRRRFGSNVPSI